MKCTVMTVFYEQRDQGGGQAAPSAATQGADDSAIKKIDCKGPVTIVSRTQVATGENATFDRGSNKIMLTGNATLDRKSTRLNSSHANISYAVFCLKKKKKTT